MKKYTPIAIVVVLLLIAAFFYVKKQKPEVIQEPDVVTQQENITGCYVARLGKDVYTLQVASQNDTAINGSLRFKNFEKDSSSGTLNGTYVDGIIRGTYAFQSEGMNSEIEVAFKKIGDGFMRGFGEMSTSSNKFVNVDAIQYDDNYIFMKADCEAAQ